MARTQKSQPHLGKSRPSGDGNFNMHVLTPQKTRDTHYRDLPPPTGQSPFQLDIADILPAKVLVQIGSSDRFK